LATPQTGYKLYPAYPVTKPSTVSKADSAASDACSAKPQGISPGDVAFVVCVGPGGAGDGAPHGISPAKAETERTNVITVVISNLFMDVSPVIRFNDARILTSNRLKQLEKLLARRKRGKLVSESQLQAFFHSR
jgi:hypothetical protein